MKLPDPPKPDALTATGIFLMAIGAGLAYLPLGIFLLGLFFLLIGLGMPDKKKGQPL